MKYIFVANGRADKKEGNRHLAEVLSGIGSDVLDWEMYVTREAGDATYYVRDHCRRHPGEKICYVACGGDGTINEVATGLFGFEGKCMSVMAMGTGNDFVKYYPDKSFKSVEGIIDGTHHQIDILQINKTRFSVNVCNCGFESIVCSIANRLSAKGETDPYNKGIIKAIIFRRRNRIVVHADGERLNRRSMLLCTFANNRYVGGEFCCAPRAFNDDGLIDVCLVKPLSLLRFFALIPLYRNGEHLDSRRFRRIMKYRRARHIEIHSAKPTELCLDGEMFAGRDFTIDIVPKGIDLIVPSK